MKTPVVLLSAGNWLDSKYLWWTLAVLGTLVVLAIVGFVLRKKSAVAVAVVRHPFAKYVILSVVAHVGLAAWLLTSHLLEEANLSPGSAIVVVEVGSNQPRPLEEAPKPWDNPPTELVKAPVPKLPEQKPDLPATERPAFPPVDDNRVDSPLADLDSVVEEFPDDLNRFADAPKPIVSEAPSPVEPIPDAKSLATSAIDTQEPAEESPFPEEPKFSTDESQQQATLDEQSNTTEDATALADAFDTPFANNTASQPKPRFNKLPQEIESEPMEVAEAPTKAKLQPNLQAVSSARTDRKSAFDQPTANRSITTKRRADGRALPAIYRDRWVADRLAIARQRGGSEETEAAVRAALVWLAKAQTADGRWNASQYGSGRPVREGGHNRGNAGINADTATTGLALLAFLGAGHTHVEGEYAKTVHRGLDFLVRAQQARRDGSLVGQATGYAAMYCHGIATLALSEAYSLTGDEALRRPVYDAIRFTQLSQHSAGGWRYEPRTSGDTSQLGWQMMALTSAHYGGFEIPSSTWANAGRFLESVSWGTNKGRASYKPDLGPTRTMTAEALLCWLFLNTSPDHPRILEAADYLLEELPGRGRLNYYYWYYGTLGLYHLQDEHWRRWNNAVTRSLLSIQQNDGSWPTANSVWGNAGGTVYTTALATMTLEVYYRYRPLSQTHHVEHTARRND